MTTEAQLRANRAWWARNAEKRNAKRRAAYAANPEPKKADAWLRYLTNRDAALATVQAYRAANPEKVRQQHREHYARNTDKRKAANHTQRAKRRQAPGSHTAADIQALHSAQRGKCAACRVRLHRFHIDHITPLSRGGSNDATNLQLLCPPCNQRKSSKDPVQFMQQLGYLL